jgi:hypothetical protein
VERKTESHPPQASPRSHAGGLPTLSDRRGGTVALAWGKAMRCTGCGIDNREGRKFCAQCGQPLKLARPSCGAHNEPAERFAVTAAAYLPVMSNRAPLNPPMRY